MDSTIDVFVTGQHIESKDIALSSVEKRAMFNMHYFVFPKRFNGGVNSEFANEFMSVTCDDDNIVVAVIDKGHGSNFISSITGGLFMNFKDCCTRRDRYGDWAIFDRKNGRKIKLHVYA